MQPQEHHKARNAGASRRQEQPSLTAWGAQSHDCKDLNSAARLRTQEMDSPWEPPERTTALPAPVRSTADFKLQNCESICSVVIAASENDTKALDLSYSGPSAPPPGEPMRREISSQRPLADHPGRGLATETHVECKQVVPVNSCSNFRCMDKIMMVVVRVVMQMTATHGRMWG